MPNRKKQGIADQSRSSFFFLKSNLLTNVSIGDRLSLSIYSRHTRILYNVESALM